MSDAPGWRVPARWCWIALAIFLLSGGLAYLYRARRSDQPGALPGDPSLREIARWRCLCVQAAAWYPHGDKIAAGATVTLPGELDWDGSPRSWAVITVPEMKDTGLGVWGGHMLDVSARGDVAIATGRKGAPRDSAATIEIYGPGVERPRFHFYMRYSHPGIRFTPDGSRLVVTDSQGLMEVWDVAKGERLASIKLLPRIVYDATAPVVGENLELDGSGSLAIVGSNTRPPLLVDLKALAVIDPKWSYGEHGFQGGYLVALSPDGARVATTFSCGGPGVYDRLSRRTLWARPWVLERKNRWTSPWTDCPRQLTDGPAALQFSPDGVLLAVAGGQGHIALFDARDGTLYDDHQGVDPNGCGVRWSPDGTRLIGWGGGGVVLYDVVRPPGWK